MRIKTRCSVLILSAAFALSGCHDHSPENALAEGCAHLKGSASVAKTLTETSGPNLTALHKRVEITFADLKDGKMGGEGTYKISDAGDHLILLTDEVPLVVTDKDGNAVAAKSEQKKPSECTAAAVANTYDFKVGTVTLTFGPTDATGVTMVLEPATGDSH